MISYIYLVGFIIFCIIVSVYLAQYIKNIGNVVATSLFILLCFLISVVITSFWGHAVPYKMADLMLNEANIISYHIGQNEDIYLFILEEGSDEPLLIKLQNLSNQESSSIAEKHAKAQGEGQNLVMQFDPTKDQKADWNIDIQPRKTEKE